MHWRLRARGNQTCKGWSLAATMMDENITLGVECHPNTVINNHNLPVACEGGVFGGS